MKKNASAFTLIELLTVIAIIGILAAILIPVVSKVREQARLSNCVSNVRQWGIAALAHADDNQGLIPWDGGTGTNPNNMELHEGTLPWFNALPPYVGSLPMHELAARNAVPQLGDGSIFVCPSAQPNDSGTPGWLCYGPNYLLSFRGSAGNRLSITSVDGVPNPSLLVLFGETTNFSPDSDGFVALNSAPQHLGARGVDRTRHNLRSPVVFFDGHVETFTSDELWEQSRGTTNPNLLKRVRWNSHPMFQ